MPRTFLKEVSISSFRSFLNTHTIKFDKTGLVLFRGKNKNTGGSSGSGKSSVNLAIAYALGIAPFPATALQSWLTDKPLEVELTLVTDNSEEVVVKRGAKLSMTVGGVAIEGGSKAIEERLYRILGVESEVLSALTYRGQRRPGLFLSKGDAEKKEFLTGLLGLSRFETTVEEVQQIIKGLETKVEASAVSVDTLTKTLDFCRPIEPNIEDVAPLKNQIDSLSLDMETKTIEIDRLNAVLHAEIVTIEAHYGKLIDSLEKEALVVGSKPFVPDNSELLEAERLAADCKLRLDKFEELYQKATDTWRTDKTDKQIKCQHLMASISSEPSLRKNHEALTKEIYVLSEMKCPTCYQPWTNGADKKREFTNKTKEIEIELERLSMQKTELASITNMLDKTLPPEQNPIHQKLSQTYQKILQRVNEATWRKNAAEYEHSSSVQAAIATKQAETQKLKYEQKEAVNQAKTSSKICLEIAALLQKNQESQRTKSGLENRVHGIVMSNRAKEEAYHQSRAKYEKVATELASAVAVLDKNKTQLDREKDFLDLIGRGGFLGSIFDEVISEISYETNHILSGIANTRHCTLDFRSEGVTKKGVTKKNIAPYITVGGYEAPLASGLSGGMIGAVELAVDLAIGTVINRRTGSYPSWLILDECFEGLGPIEKESCMEMLQKYSSDKLILVVDHASEFQEMFGQQIDIEFEDGISSVKNLTQ